MSLMAQGVAIQKLACDLWRDRSEFPNHKPHQQFWALVCFLDLKVTREVTPI